MQYVDVIVELFSAVMKKMSSKHVASGVEQKDYELPRIFRFRITVASLYS